MLSHSWIRVRHWQPFGAEIWLHWSLVALLAAALLFVARDPAQMALVLASYFLALVVHESGHAWMARRLGYQVTRLEFSPFHGMCHYDGSDASARDLSLIACAGPLAQLSLAAVVLGLGTIPAVREFDPFGPVYVFAGYFNVAWGLMNLLPVRGLDGEDAWKGFRHLVQMRRRVDKPSGKPRNPRPPLRRVK